MKPQRCSRIAISAAALLALTACATGSPSRDQGLSTAVVTILWISPAPPAVVTRDSVLLGDLHYAITNFQPGAQYYLAPLFRHRDGQTTFNELPGFRDSNVLTSREGKVRIEYPIAREWDSGKLAQPIVVFFYVLQRTASHQANRIGKSSELSYSIVP